jgi:hypothetical protein
MQNIDPIIIKQFLDYWLIVNGLDLILPLIVLGFSIYGLKIALKEKDDKFGSLMFIIAFFCILLSTIPISGIIKIVYAPNLYLLEHKQEVEKITKQ